MLSFTEWQEALGEIEEELGYLEDLIAYRKIEIKCAETPDPRRRLTEAQQEILDADPVLRDLNYKREYYISKRVYLQQYGGLPPEV